MTSLGELLKETPTRRCKTPIDQVFKSTVVPKGCDIDMRFGPSVVVLLNKI